jgi:chromosome segregation protein
VDALEGVPELVSELAGGEVTFVGGDAPAKGIDEDSDSLAALVRAPATALPLLAGVKAATTLEEAMARRRGLRPGESVVTRQGIWIGPNWLRVSRAEDDEHHGVIEREGELRSLREIVGAAEARLRTAQEANETNRSAVLQLEDEREQFLALANESHREHANLRGQLEAVRSRAEQATQRLERLKAEAAETAASIQSDDAEIRESRQRLQAGLAEMEQIEDRRTVLEQERDSLRAGLEQARQQAQVDVAAAQQLAIRVESQRSTLASLRTSLERISTQVQQLQARRKDLSEQLESGEAPLQQMETRLQEALDRRLLVERELTEARRAVDEAEAGVREREEQRAGRDAAVLAQRDRLDQVRMSAQEARVRRESLLEQFAATRLELDAVRAQLPAEATVLAWDEALADLQGKIERLGAVNLASIDELKEQSERKEYLDRQFADLTDALATLEEAIRKIDRETRSRFQDTFDRVNAGLKEKFPKLFGGGSAYLELVGEDTLTAGVAVMARPPGKRNSTISQLSGGEKALTAVALVFSIFELNPAPFCLLDEVDAPLDDNNVGRFCDIVRDMAERVQFIFITHNKSTMELAGQLIGVTMNEPGVSRLVAVDVDEAVRMATG